MPSPLVSLYMATYLKHTQMYDFKRTYTYTYTYTCI